MKKEFGEWRRILYRHRAGMAELADAHDSGSCVLTDMQVQVLFPAPHKKPLTKVRGFLCMKRPSGMKPLRCREGALAHRGLRTARRASADPKPKAGPVPDLGRRRNEENKASGRFASFRAQRGPSLAAKRRLHFFISAFSASSKIPLSAAAHFSPSAGRKVC